LKSNLPVGVVGEVTTDVVGGGAETWNILS